MSVALWLLNGVTACSRFVEQIVCEIAATNEKDFLHFTAILTGPINLWAMHSHLPKRYASG